MKSSRLRVALVAVPVELWSLPLFHSVEIVIVFSDVSYVIIILYS
jgi:hypothetical protein